MMTRMDNSRFLITGATGLIGSALVNYLLKWNPNVQMVLPVRNKTKAESMLADSANVTIVECDLLTTDFEFTQDIDYIVHCASPTASAYFVENPVETYNSVFLPSLHLLQYATRHEVKGFVYLSSLEVYGTVTDDGKLLMVRQYRNALDRYTLEIPAGGMNPGEDYKVAAARELEEETGYKSDELEFLIKVNTTVAFCNEEIGIYVARNLVKSEQRLDEDEYIDVVAMDVEELCNMIYEAKIKDGKTISAILAYKNKYVEKN